MVQGCRDLRPFRLRVQSLSRNKKSEGPGSPEPSAAYGVPIFHGDGFVLEKLRSQRPGCGRCEDQVVVVVVVVVGRQGGREAGR